jgi:hypothetical protein
MDVRKISVTRETVFADAGKSITRPVARVLAIAVVDTPFAGRFVDDLSPLFTRGAELGAVLLEPSRRKLTSRSSTLR